MGPIQHIKIDKGLQFEPEGTRKVIRIFKRMENLLYCFLV